MLKVNSPGEWDETRTGLIEKISKLPFSEKRRDIIALIYQEDNLQSELIDYLKKTQSIDLLIMFDEHLFKDFSKRPERFSAVMKILCLNGKHIFFLRAS